jgi:hypothetical protein
MLVSRRAELPCKSAFIDKKDGKNNADSRLISTWGPVVQSWVSLTLGKLKIQSKLPDSLSINLEIFLQRSCLDR